MWKLIAISLAGAVGTGARYAISAGMLRWLGPAFPLGTLTVNVLGSFALAIVMELAGDRQIAGVSAKLVLGTGLLGGFTTYSSFNLETLRLFEQGAYGRGALYVSATVVVCLLAALAGAALARSLLRSS
jgi:CrcB protein